MPDWFNPIEIDGALIRKVRRRLLLTQAQMADRLGVTRRTLIRWETGGAKFDRYARTPHKRYPQLAEQAKLARVKLPPCDRERKW